MPRLIVTSEEPPIKIRDVDDMVAVHFLDHRTEYVSVRDFLMQEEAFRKRGFTRATGFRSDQK